MTVEQQELNESTKRFVDFSISKGYFEPLPSPDFLAKAVDLKVNGTINHKDMLFIINVEKVRIFFEKHSDLKQQVERVFDESYR